MLPRPALFVLLAFGCARPPAPPPPADPSPGSASGGQVSAIRLERIPGGVTATGPGYVFTLRREGLSTYEGKSGVPMLGNYHVVIPAAAFTQLADKLLANGYFARRAVYLRGQCADVQGVRVTLTIDGKADTLAPSCPGPEFNQEMAAPIDSVAGRLPWTVSLKL